MFAFADKVAVVTGAGSGIGAALARECARRGMRVVAADINRDRVEATAASLPDPTAACAHVVDVSNASDVDRLADVAYATFGATHLLCNVAGISPLGMIWEFTPEDWDRLLGVNLIGTANVIRSFVPRMITADEPGHVMNTGSGASFQGQSILGPYVATKHAILGLTDSLRQELVPHNIGVSLLCPGGVNTNIVESMARPSSTGDKSEVWNYISTMMADNDEATNTMIEPDVVAEQALWGIQEGLPYIICAPGQKARVEKRFQTILDAHDRAAAHDERLP